MACMECNVSEMSPIKTLTFNLGKGYLKEKVFALVLLWNLWNFPILQYCASTYERRIERKLVLSSFYFFTIFFFFLNRLLNFIIILQTNTSIIRFQIQF